MRGSGGTFLFALLADGPSDQALVPIQRWVLQQQNPALRLRTPLFEPRRPPGAPLRAAIEKLASSHRPDLIFVHRDAENELLSVRKAQIPRMTGVVPVIPVRMTEAWLLIEEQAIRTASGNPNGSMQLSMPPIARLEHLPDPKGVLRDLLATASGHRGRRRRQRFDRPSAVQRVADFIRDPAALRQLEAFRDLECELQAMLNATRPRP